MLEKDLTIIGGGSAGMAAALGARKKGIESILILENREELGGVLNQCIHSGFGLEFFNKDLTGPEYGEMLFGKIKEKNIEYLVDTTAVEIMDNKIVKVRNPERGQFLIKSKAIILATGGRERALNTLILNNERPKGILSAGTVQELINIRGINLHGKAVIIGSGDIGLIMARRMRLNGMDIRGVIEIEKKPSGLERNVKLCLEDFNIPLFTETRLKTIVGKEKLEKIIVEDKDKNLREIETDYLIYSIGLVPDRDILKQETEGIFPCGNAKEIYATVDKLTIEALKTGEKVGEYILGGRK